MGDRNEKQANIPGRKPKPFLFKSALYGFLVLIFVAFCVKSFIDTEFSFDFLKHKVVIMNEQTGESEWAMRWGASESTLNALSQIAHPDLSWKVVKKLLLDMWLTVEIALVGTLLSIIFSFPLSFLGAHNLTKGNFAGRTVFFITRLIFNLARAFPPILLALLFVLVVGVGPFAGVLALALHSVGMLGKLFSESIENIDQGQVEAVEAVGAHPVQVVWFGILPQVLPQFVAFSLYRWDINIRMSIIIGIVGAGGIGFILDQYIKNMAYDKASTAFLIILVAVTLLDWASTWFRTRFD
ncbi:phosphonate ABC transporter, permease protein PhnE [bacterium]|nr:phosphonate ABC transporter, permease protein PhnE [bacterium]